MTKDVHYTTSSLNLADHCANVWREKMMQLAEQITDVGDGWVRLVQLEEILAAARVYGVELPDRPAPALLTVQAAVKAGLPKPQLACAVCGGLFDAAKLSPTPTDPSRGPTCRGCLDRERLRRALETAKRLLSEIVVTEGEDAGVILKSAESPTLTHPETGHQVYQYENFSELGDALVALARQLNTALTRPSL